MVSKLMKNNNIQLILNNFKQGDIQNHSMLQMINYHNQLKKYTVFLNEAIETLRLIHHSIETES